MKEKISASVKKMKKEHWIICGVIGLLLLVISMPVRKSSTQNSAGEQTVIMETAAEEGIREECERQLEEVLGQVAGVGKVKVAISMESTGQRIVEKDYSEDTQESESSGDSKSSSHSVSTGEQTVFEEDGSGKQTPYVISEVYPEIRGVLVVAEGGGNAEIIQQINEAVMALFHVEAHKIKVLKMK